MQILLFAVKEMWWAAVLAAGMHYLGGSTGHVVELATYMFFFRALKLPMKLLCKVRLEIGDVKEVAAYRFAFRKLKRLLKLLCKETLEIGGIELEFRDGWDFAASILREDYM